MAVFTFSGYNVNRTLIASIQCEAWNGNAMTERALLKVVGESVDEILRKVIVPNFFKLSNCRATSRRKEEGKGSIRRPVNLDKFRGSGREIFSDGISKFIITEKWNGVRVADGMMGLP